jgi:hypothetical protein
MLMREAPHLCPHSPQKHSFPNPFGTHISKLDNRYKEGQFLGYNLKNSDSHIWDTKLHWSVTTQDLTFSESFKAQDTAITVDLIANAKENGQIGPETVI